MIEMSTDIRDALYRLLESAEPSAEFKEELSKLERDLNAITNNIIRLKGLIEHSNKMQIEWRLEREGMDLIVGLIAEKYDGFDEDNLDELELEDAEVLRHIFDIDVKKRDRHFDIKIQMWAMLLKEYQKREMLVIEEIEEFKVSLEDEIARSFVGKWKEFSKTRKGLNDGNY